jgi:hypothetical protein
MTNTFKVFVIFFGSVTSFVIIFNLFLENKSGYKF